MAPEMQTAPPPAESASAQTILALFSYNDSRLKEVVPLFNPLSVDSKLRFVKASPAHRDQLWCDIVCMLYDQKVDFETYTQDIATLKLVRKIPAVLALVFDADQAFIEQHKGVLAADAVLYLPQAPEQFA
jgi:hypothetical protein